MPISHGRVTSSAGARSAVDLSGPELRVSVVHDEIIVTSFYSVTYYQPENSPQLLAKRIVDHDDLRFPMTAAEFFNAAVVLLANVIAHQSETFSEAEDATDKLGVIVCRMAHALMRHEANQ